MVQELVVILAVMGCGAWLGLQMYRYVKPKAGGKMCGGGCCDGEEAPKAAAAKGGERVMMISSDDMRARIKRGGDECDDGWVGGEVENIIRN